MDWIPIGQVVYKVVIRYVDDKEASDYGHLYWRYEKVPEGEENPWRDLGDICCGELELEIKCTDQETFLEKMIDSFLDALIDEFSQEFAQILLERLRDFLTRKSRRTLEGGPRRLPDFSRELPEVIIERPVTGQDGNTDDPDADIREIFIDIGIDTLHNFFDAWTITSYANATADCYSGHVVTETPCDEEAGFLDVLAEYIGASFLEGFVEELAEVILGELVSEIREKLAFLFAGRKFITLATASRRLALLLRFAGGLQGLAATLIAEFVVSNFYDWFFAAQRDCLEGPPGEKGEDGLPGLPGEDGEDGREIEAKVEDGHLFIRYAGEGDEAWQDLGKVKGEDGRDPHFRLDVLPNSDAYGHIFWKYTEQTEQEWIDLGNIKGEPGYSVISAGYHKLILEQTTPSIVKALVQWWCATDPLMEVFEPREEPREIAELELPAGPVGPKGDFQHITASNPDNRTDILDIYRQQWTHDASQAIDPEPIFVGRIIAPDGKYWNITASNPDGRTDVIYFYRQLLFSDGTPATDPPDPQQFGGLIAPQGPKGEPGQDGQEGKEGKYWDIWNQVPDGYGGRAIHLYKRLKNADGTDADTYIRPLVTASIDWLYPVITTTAMDGGLALFSQRFRETVDGDVYPLTDRTQIGFLQGGGGTTTKPECLKISYVAYKLAKMSSQLLTAAYLEIDTGPYPVGDGDWWFSMRFRLRQILVPALEFIIENAPTKVKGLDKILESIDLDWISDILFNINVDVVYNISRNEFVMKAAELLYCQIWTHHSLTDAEISHMREQVNIWGDFTAYDLGLVHTDPELAGYAIASYIMRFVDEHPDSFRSAVNAWYYEADYNYGPDLCYLDCTDVPPPPTEPCITYDLTAGAQGWTVVNNQYGAYGLFTGEGLETADIAGQQRLWIERTVANPTSIIWVRLTFKEPIVAGRTAGWKVEKNRNDESGYHGLDSGDQFANIGGEGATEAIMAVASGETIGFFLDLDQNSTPAIITEVKICGTEEAPYQG